MVLWEQAQLVARDMQSHWDGHTVVPTRELTLLLYGLAGERACEPAEVTDAWLRYLCGDPQSCLTWLCAQLQRMGHQVSPPLLVDEARFKRQVESQGGVRRLDDAGPGDEWVRRITSDDVARAWFHATIFTSETDELDGAEITWPATCKLVQAMPSISTHLDSQLRAERGGRPAGAAVASMTIAPYASPRGLTAAECRVHPHRAIVTDPYWEMNHTDRTVAPGPPAGYYVNYRHLLTGEPEPSTRDLVAAEHLHSDPTDWDPAADLAVVVPGALTTIPGPEPEQRCRTLEPLDAQLRALSQIQKTQLRVVGAPPGLQDPAVKYRAAALARLWQLRDQELLKVGDSTSRSVAQRIANEPGYPQPADPPMLIDLEADEAARHINEAYGTAPRPWSSAAPRDRHLVTGRRRELLLQWLSQVTDQLTTARVIAALDGFAGATSITAARHLLAAEGFVQVADLHRNAGAAVTVLDLDPSRRLSITPPGADIPDPDDLGPDSIDLVFAHPIDGHIATLHAYGHGHGRPSLSNIRVWSKVLPLDRQMFSSLGSSGAYAFTTDRTNTGIHDGEFGVQPRFGRTGGSLRVHLAGLRAFTIPAWTPLARLRLGSDGADQVALHRELCEQAPHWVLKLLPTSPQQY